MTPNEQNFRVVLSNGRKRLHAARAVLSSGINPTLEGCRYIIDLALLIEEYGQNLLQEYYGYLTAAYNTNYDAVVRTVSYAFENICTHTDCYCALPCAKTTKKHHCAIRISSILKHYETQNAVSNRDRRDKTFAANDVHNYDFAAEYAHADIAREVAAVNDSANEVADNDLYSPRANIAREVAAVNDDEFTISIEHLIDNPTRYNLDIALRQIGIGTAHARILITDTVSEYVLTRKFEQSLEKVAANHGVSYSAAIRRIKRALPDDDSLHSAIDRFIGAPTNISYYTVKDILATIYLFCSLPSYFACSSARLSA